MNKNFIKNLFFWTSVHLFLCLLILETMLHLLGRENSTRFLVESKLASPHSKTASGERLQTNPGFGLKFFPPDKLQRIEIQSFPAYPDENEFRVLMVGGSAARGFPEPAFGFSRLLDIALQNSHPEAKIRILNATLPNADSRICEHIVDQSSPFHPDLVILYTGNNEFRKSRPGRRFWSYSRTVQWFERILSDRFGSFPKPDRLETVSDPTSIQKRYRSFGRNLNRIAEHCSDMQAKLLVLTVPVNLNDCPPFRGSEAIRQYEKALQALKDGKTEQSFVAFTLARDMDLLRIRADSAINGAISNLARRKDSTFIRILDAERVLDEQSAKGIPGNDWFVDPIHLRPEGYAELAWQTAAIIHPWFFPESGESRQIPSSELLKQAGYTDYATVKILFALSEQLLHPPYNRQLGHAERLFELKQELRNRRKSLDLKETLTELRNIREKHPRDPVLAQWEASVLNASGEFNQAVQILTEVSHQEVLNLGLRLDLAISLALSGKISESRELLLQPSPDSTYSEAQRLADVAAALNNRGYAEQARELIKVDAHRYPYNGPIQAEVGRSYLLSGNQEQALKYFEAAEKAGSPATVSWQLALLYSRAGLIVEGLSRMQALRDQNPDDAEGLTLYGRALQKAGDSIRAKQVLTEARKLDPSSSAATLALAEIYWHSETIQRSRDLLEETVRWHPDSDDAIIRLSRLLCVTGEPELGIQRLERFLAKHAGSDLHVQNELAWTLATIASDAMANGKRALELATNLCEKTQNQTLLFLDTLAAAQAAAGEFEQAAETQKHIIEITRKMNQNLDYFAANQKLARYENQQRWIEPLTPPWRH